MRIRTQFEMNCKTKSRPQIASTLEVSMRVANFGTASKCGVMVQRHSNEPYPQNWQPNPGAGVHRQDTCRLSRSRQQSGTLPQWPAAMRPCLELLWHLRSYLFFFSRSRSIANRHRTPLDGSSTARGRTSRGHKRRWYSTTLVTSVTHWTSCGTTSTTRSRGICILTIRSLLKFTFIWPSCTSTSIQPMHKHLACFGHHSCSCVAGEFWSTS